MDITASSEEPPSSSPGEIIRRAKGLSRYFRRLTENEPALLDELLENLHQPFDPREMQSVLDSMKIQDETSLSASLRRLRKRVMLRLIARDLGGLADLDEVVGTATRLAEVTLRFAQHHLTEWLHAVHGNPIGSENGVAVDLIVVGMGKLGGGELNVSSDIDLIFVYPEDGETSGPRQISNYEFFTKLGRSLIAALNEPTAEGQVFRVDMRLRPYGESGPLVASLAMLEEYFISQGREWERYAWIKARPISGSRADELSQLVRPFVYRKYLDFGAYSSLRGLHHQIQQEVKRRNMQADIKLGPGGIREIEFIAQVFQLIRGGRDPGLRERSTQEIIRRLDERSLLPAAAASELNEAYRFLRNLEHRLQYLDDQQTQALPKSPDDQKVIAEAMGYGSWEEFESGLNGHRASVTRQFEQVFATQHDVQEHELAWLWRDQVSADEATVRLSTLGYLEPGPIHERLTQIRRSHRYRQLPEASQARFDSLVPALIQTAAEFPNPDQTLEQMLALLEAVSRRAAYLALLLEYPQTLERLCKLASTSRWACDYLIRHPILMDEFIDMRLLYSPPDWNQLGIALEAQLQDAEGDTERQMDILRHFRHTQTFRLLAQDLAGLLPLETLSDHLSDLADLILSQTLSLCWKGLQGKHREEPRFGIIGYGKLGGKELGYVSDLDIIFLYDDPSPEAQETYAKLAKRINSWLVSYTPAGVLYETDLRLRPDGASGLLVSHVSAFDEYQKKQAWLWEHQALTRARFVAGDREVGEHFESIRKEVLCQNRNRGELGNGILAMREKMMESHPNPSALFDIKYDRGGIIDVEFIVQYLVLAHSHEYPTLTLNIGNLALLKLASELGLIPAAQAEEVREGYREFRRIQHRMRLNGERFARLPPASVKRHTDAVLVLWRTVFGE